MKRDIARNAQRYFLTGVSMITSIGHKGQNVMAAEWTMQISHEPMLIAVFIHKGSITLSNIIKTKEFGVNVASDEQTTAVSISGGYSREEIDKLSISDSYKLLKSKKIKPPLIDGCIINAECKLLATKKIGDHTMIVGKVISIQYDKTKKPLVYHQGRYFGIGSMIQPIRREITVNQKTFNLFKKESQGQFVLKCVGAVVRIGTKILVSDDSRKDTPHVIPYVVPPRDKNHKKVLEKHLKKIKLNLILDTTPSLKRIVLKSDRKVQRINFVLFTGVLKKKSVVNKLVSIKNDPLLQALIK